MNQHDSYLTAPDDSDKVANKAIPPPAAPRVVIPGLNEVLPSGMPKAAPRGSLYGMRLARSGIRLLTIALGIAATWFVAAWVHHGRMPLLLSHPSPRLWIGVVHVQERILPPVWLTAVLGLLVLVALVMMVVGTQDATPKMNH